MFWMIPLALKGLAIATTTIFAAAMFEVIIEDIISYFTVQEVMDEKGLERVLIRAVDRTSNKISFRDLDTFDDWELTGTGIADDIHVGDKIYV